MDKNKGYSTTLKTRSFLYLETKKTADLIHKGFKTFEIRDMAIKDNLFQLKTESRKKEIASATLSRLKDVDKYVIGKIAYGDAETSKMLVLYSIMKTDRLFFEFMNEVYREKLILKETLLQDKDFNLFFDAKKQQSEKVASWEDYTYYKLQQVYIRILFEAGILKNQKGDREMVRGYIDYETKQHLKDTGEQIYISILEGE